VIKIIFDFHLSRGSNMSLRSEMKSTGRVSVKFQSKPIEVEMCERADENDGLH
jgi:hypothetical protein